MQFYRHAGETATRVIQAFERGEVPKALTQVFIRHSGNRHADGYSWGNQLLVALAGFSDAMGYRQWETVGRHVKKGERALHILAPVTKKRIVKDKETDEEIPVTVTVGFTTTAVFGTEQTEGEPYPGAPGKGDTEFIESLPLLDVARRWGLSVQTYNGKDGKALGWYRHGSAIALGVKNISTWAHELVHAADDRLGELKSDCLKHRLETVAEFGGAVLLHLLGEHSAADEASLRWVAVALLPVVLPGPDPDVLSALVPRAVDHHTAACAPRYRGDEAIRRLQWERRCCWRRTDHGYSSPLTYTERPLSASSFYT